MTEDQLRAEWSSNPDVRSEFNHDFETFRCFREASDAGNVRILGGGARRKMLRCAEPDSPTFFSSLMQQWKHSPELQAEFDGDMDAYFEFCTNEHRVKILGA